MVPEEWPIAVEPADRTVDSAPARSPSRLATIRRDFFLDSGKRLTEQERALLTAMLHDVVGTLVVAVRAVGGFNLDPPATARIADKLRGAGLLDRIDFMRLMLRRADEQRIQTIFAGHNDPRRLPMLPKLVGDGDPAVAAAAMALVVARGRRRDGFGRPRIELSDLERHDASALAHGVAAALSPSPTADNSFATAATQVVEGIEPGESLDHAVGALVDLLHRAGRADDAFVEAASAEGEVALVAMLIARRAGINLPTVWDHLVNAGEGGLALVTRMAGFSRPTAARLIADLGSTAGSGSVEDEIARYDELGATDVQAALRYWQLPPDYRAAVRDLGGHDG